MNEGGHIPGQNVSVTEFQPQQRKFADTHAFNLSFFFNFSIALNVLVCFHSILVFFSDIFLWYEKKRVIKHYDFGSKLEEIM